MLLVSRAVMHCLLVFVLWDVGWPPRLRKKLMGPLISLRGYTCLIHGEVMLDDVTVPDDLLSFDRLGGLLSLLHRPASE